MIKKGSHVLFCDMDGYILSTVMDIDDYEIKIKTQKMEEINIFNTGRYTDLLLIELPENISELKLEFLKLLYRNESWG